MPNRNYIRGRQREYRVMNMLEDLGYICVRAAGSKGMFDVVAIGPKDIRLVQVKLNRNASPKEKAILKDFDAHPGNVVKEIWLFKDGCRLPLINRI